MYYLSGVWALRSGFSSDGLEIWNVRSADSFKEWGIEQVLIEDALASSTEGRLPCVELMLADAPLDTLAAIAVNRTYNGKNLYAVASKYRALCDILTEGNFELLLAEMQRHPTLWKNDLTASSAMERALAYEFYSVISTLRSASNWRDIEEFIVCYYASGWELFNTFLIHASEGAEYVSLAELAAECRQKQLAH